MPFNNTLRCAAAVLGAAMLVGAATASFAEEHHGDEGVEVVVEIDETSGGVLALSVADTQATLAEDGSDHLIRQFTGSLPTVTVTDTRSAEEIPEGAFWYVLGSSTDFVGDGGQNPISAGHLGWAPQLIDGGEEGLVSEGDEVVTILDEPTLPGNNVGLVDQELLAMAADSGAIAHEGQWTATADLFLRVPIGVEAGTYSAVITLSLFE
jgi:hypothetical protein